MAIESLIRFEIVEVCYRRIRLGRCLRRGALGVCSDRSGAEKEREFERVV